jgi:hypothetical protein
LAETDGSGVGAAGRQRAVPRLLRLHETTFYPGGFAIGSPLRLGSVSVGRALCAEGPPPWHDAHQFLVGEGPECGGDGAPAHAVVAR